MMLRLIILFKPLFKKENCHHKMTTKTYNVTKRNQIIDLNGDSVNFDVTFNAKSKEGKPFYVSVVDQDSLDKGEKINFKQSENGEISANIVSDKNIYKSYNLVIRADEDCQVDITIDKKLIQPVVQQPVAQPSPVQQAPMQVARPPQKKKGWKSWKKIMLIVVVVLGIALLAYFYFGGKSSSGESTKTVEDSCSPSNTPDSTYSNISSLSRDIDNIVPSP